MLTVRFPDCFSITYNSATKTRFENGRFILSNDHDQWVAQVGPNCIVEAGTPSNFSNPNRNPSSMIRYVLDHLREMPESSLRHLKSELQDFNATERRWMR